MKKVSSMGLALFLCLGMAACNGGNNTGSENQSDNNNPTNQQKEDSGAEVNNLGPVSLAGLKMVKDDSGKTQLVATFDGDVQDLDARLADTSVTLEYIGDKYIPLVEKNSWLQKDQFSYLYREMLDSVSSYNPFYLSLSQDLFENISLYSKYASFGFIGSELLDNRSALLDDISHYNYSSKVINNVIVDSDIYAVPGQLSKGAVYSFQLGGNFSCYDFNEANNFNYMMLGYIGYVATFETIPAHFMLTDKSDACLADVREAIQGWLDMTLGQNKISVVMTEVTALDAWQVTSVILEVKEDIKLDPAAVLDKKELADSTLDSGRYWYNTLDALSDSSFEVLRLGLPANLITDIEGHPNGQADLLLSNIYSMNKVYNKLYTDGGDFEVEHIRYYWDSDNNNWKKDEKIKIEFSPWIVNGELAAVTLQKSLKEQNVPVNVKYCRMDEVDCTQGEFLLIAQEDIKLPLEISIPSGVFIFRDSSKNKAITVKLDNVTAPKIYTTESGSTVFLDLAMYNGDRGGRLIAGDIFAVEFSEPIADYNTSVCEQISGLITSGLKLDKNDVGVYCEPSGFGVKLLTDLTISVNEKLSFGTLSAADIKDAIDGDDENTKIAMAADVELFINKADFLVPPENYTGEQGQLIGAVDFNWGGHGFPFNKADGTPLDDEEVKALLAKMTLENGTVIGGELSADWWKLENINDDWWVLTLMIPSGVKIAPDFSKMEDNGIVPVAFVLPEGAFDPYGISTKGQKLIIEVNSEDYIIPLEEVTVKASYEGFNCDNGALKSNSRIVFKFDGDMARVMDDCYEYDCYEFGVLYDELSKKLTAVNGGDSKVEFNIYGNLFPNGIFQVIFEPVYSESTPIVLDEPFEIQIQVEGRLLKLELPATGEVGDTLTILDGNPADGLLTKGDLIEFHSSCYSENRYDNYFENFAAVLPDVVVMGFDEERDVTALFRYVGDKAIDVSQGLKIGDLELKEEKIDPITFKYVAGSANGNQAVYEAAQIKGGNYLLQSVENMTLSADDYFVFVPGGMAVGFTDYYTDNDFWNFWNDSFGIRSEPTIVPIAPGNF